jgi:hypothetical protein
MASDIASDASSSSSEEESSSNSSNSSNSDSEGSESSSESEESSSGSEERERDAAREEKDLQVQRDVEQIRSISLSMDRIKKRLEYKYISVLREVAGINKEEVETQTTTPSGDLEREVEPVEEMQSVLTSSKEQEELPDHPEDDEDAQSATHPPTARLLPSSPDQLPESDEDLAEVASEGQSDGDLDDGDIFLDVVEFPTSNAALIQRAKDVLLR